MKLSNLKKIKKPSRLENRIPSLERELEFLQYRNIRQERQLEIMQSLVYIEHRLKEDK